MNDEVFKCFVCRQVYETNLSTLLKDPKNRIPLVCTVCSGTCCACCVGLEEARRFAKCPHCAKRGIDRYSPSIALSLIKKLQNGSIPGLPPQARRLELPDVVVDLIDYQPTVLSEKPTLLVERSLQTIKQNTESFESGESSEQQRQQASAQSTPEPPQKARTSSLKKTVIFDGNNSKDGLKLVSKVARDGEKPGIESQSERRAKATPSSPTSVINQRSKYPADNKDDNRKRERKNNYTKFEVIHADRIASDEKKRKPNSVTPEGAISEKTGTKATRPIQAQRPAALGGSVRHQDLSLIQRAIHVKMEQHKAKKEEQEKVERQETKSPLARLPVERRARAEAWLNANLDPETLQGRFVFRRGCHPACISTILGGQGTHPFPTVDNVPQLDIFGGQANPFIKQGEMYFAGRGDFNPWGPSFPGDSGLLNREPLQQMKQETFHLFVQCSKKPWEDHYQGPDAKGKYLYMGRYRSVESDPETEVEETSRTFMFQQLSEESKYAMAEFFERRQSLVEFQRGNFCGPEDLGPYLNGGVPKASRINAWIRMLEDKEFRIEIAPVELAEYDENLYRTLVEIGAPNGQVSTQFEHIGPV